MLPKVSFRKIVKYIIFFLSLYIILKQTIKGACSDKVLLCTTIATCVFVILDIICPLVKICQPPSVARGVDDACEQSSQATCRQCCKKENESK
jgi:hypothetical protein